MTKKVYIRSYGCQMNVYDARRMADALAPAGYVQTSEPDSADLVILNTCHIREKAAEKVYSDLGRLRAASRTAAGPATDVEPAGPLIAVAGCVAQAEGAEIARRAPWVDLVFGPQTYHRLPDMVQRAKAYRAQRVRHGDKVAVIETEFPAESKFDYLPEESAPQGPSAFLTVQEGCDRFCSFCVVPYTRGVEYSRPAPSILAEARRLVHQGSAEITLLGQNVNAYHGRGADSATWTLAQLIRALAEIDGLDRIRYTTSHPRDMGEELIAAHGAVAKLMPHLHLAVQSGSDRVLARMNRGHRIADYLRTIAALRSARTDIAISTDLIVGHPGETEADFRETLNLVREVGYAQAYTFAYSPRPGTPAASMEDLVEDRVKSDRLSRLQALIAEYQQIFNQATVGTVLPVLFDRPGHRALQAGGRTPYMQAAHAAFATPSETAAVHGRIVACRVLAVQVNSLRVEAATGKIETPAPAHRRSVPA